MITAERTECHSATKSYFDFDRDYGQSLAIA
jgi:hypothetical protein